VVWFSGPIDPAVTEGLIEFWLGEAGVGELLLTIQADHFPVLPSQGMYVRYKPLEGVEEAYQIGDVKIVLEEDQTAGYPENPPDPAIPGSIYLRPVIKIELQP
jgi:hypothetical protein